MKAMSMNWSLAGLQIKTVSSIYIFETKHLLRMTLIAFLALIGILWSFNLINFSQSPLVPGKGEMRTSLLIVKKNIIPQMALQRNLSKIDVVLKKVPTAEELPKPVAISKNDDIKLFCKNKTLSFQGWSIEAISNFQQIAKQLVSGKVGPITKTRIRELHRICRTKFYSGR